MINLLLHVLLTNSFWIRQQEVISSNGAFSYYYVIESRKKSRDASRWFYFNIWLNILQNLKEAALDTIN